MLTIFTYCSLRHPESLSLSLLDPIDSRQRWWQRDGPHGEEQREGESHLASLRRSVLRLTLKRRAAAAWLLPAMTASTALSIGLLGAIPHLATTGRQA